MACFLVPAAEAVVTTIAKKVVESRERKEADAPCVHLDTDTVAVQEEEMPFSRKVRWLNIMLWGGSALLALEHLWHGELTFRFPFLTAASDPAAMLHEMMTVGVAMAAVVTGVWLVMVAVSNGMEKRAAGRKDPAAEVKEEIA